MGKPGGRRKSNEEAKMRYMMLATIMLTLLSGSAFAEYQFQITTERAADPDGVLTCANWRGVAVQFDQTGEQRNIHTKIPDENCISSEDNQEWFVEVESALGAGSYLVSFSAAAEGLEIPKKGALQYWFRYSKDGVIWSGASAKALMRPKKPTGR